MIRGKLLKKAFLIGAPGGDNISTKYLPGVEKDLKNVKRFLMSVNGGGWLESEITILPFANFRSVRSELENSQLDYQVIYFSGHGFVYNGYNHLMFQDEPVCDTDLINPYIPKQLIICDACRVPVSFGKISGISPDENDWQNFTGIDWSVREIFDQWIEESENGVQIFHAVPHGFSALDTHHGGLFTKRLIDAAEKEMITYDEYSFASLNDIVNYLNHPDIAQYKAYNMPQRTYCKGNLNVPFAVSLPTDLCSEESYVLERGTGIVSQQTNWGGLALFALGVVAIATMLDTK